MKKIKLFALAVMSMLGTNAMAQSIEWANTTFTYEYAAEADNTTATIKGFVQELSTVDMATVTIPEAVPTKTGKKAKVTAIAADAFKGNTNITKVIFAHSNLTTINATAFSGCTALASVDFTAATGLTTIGAGAFTGCPFTTLDLSTTKLGAVNNIMGTDFDNADKTKRVVNTTLTTLKLSAWWSTIGEKAFAGCTALATVDLNTVTTAADAPATQAFTTGNNFAGCPITSLDFSGTKVTTLPATLLLDGTIYTENTSLTSVTLTENFTALNAALSNCVNLATLTGYIKVNGSTKTSALTTLVVNEFRNDAKLTSFDFSKITTLNNYAFAGTGLTAVAFPKDAIAAIPEGCFMECANLATVTWDAAEVTLASIGEKAFAGTAIASITFPVGANFDLTSANTIADKAFAACENLTTVIWKKTTDATPTAQYINASAFAFCNEVSFYTGDLQIAYFTTAGNEVTNVTFKRQIDAPGTAITKLTMTAYKNGSGKYYYKMNATANTAIVKGDAKVYSAYAEAADDAVLNMVSYKPENGKYQIAAGDICLIVSENAEVELSEYNGTGSGSMATAFDAVGGNALKMNAAATTRLSLLLAAPDDSYSIYGWVNSANGTGFQKITSGSNIPANTLYAYAKEPAAGGRLIVKWYDENGNLEGETTGIQSVEAQAAEAEGESFNLSGQKVAAGYKGIVIKNGKKMIVK